MKLMKRKTLTLLVLVILISQAFLFSPKIPTVKADVSGSANIVVNPGFETENFANWTMTGGCQVVNTGHHSGLYMATLPWPDGRLRQDFSIPGRSIVELGFWAYAAVTHYVELGLFYSDGSYSAFYKEVLGDAPTWHYLDFTSSVNASKTLVAFRINPYQSSTAVDDVVLKVLPIVTADLDDVDPSSQDWVFTEWRHYTFQVTFPAVFYPSGSPDTAWLGFEIQTSDGVCNFATWSDGTEWNYAVGLNNPASSNATRSLDPVRIKAGSSSLNATYYVISFPIWFTEKCLDTLNLADAVDVYMRLNDTAGVDTGWILGASEFFQVYNRGGGSTETQVLGSAGQIVGGKQFSFYAYNGSQVYSDMIFRNLQHIKMLPEIKAYSGYEQYTVSGGVDYSLDDGSYLRGWQFDIEVDEVAYTGWLTSQNWINMTVAWSFNNSWVKTDNIYMFYYGPVTASGQLLRYRFWIDLWFDNMNASSFGGGRINAYEYPMEDTSAVYLRWLNSNWGVKESVEKESMCLFPLFDSDGVQLSTSRISMVKVWMALGVDDGQAGQYAIMDKFDVWDTTLGKIPLEGMQTPSFDETKMPVMQNSGFLGFLFSAFTGLFKWISDNIIFGGLSLWPTFVGFLDMIASWLGMPNGFSNLIAWLGTGWGWLVSSFTYALTIIYDIFLMLASVIGSLIWMLGQAIVSFASVIGMIAGFLAGTFGGAGDLWTQLGLSTWITVAIIFYPLYLIILWDQKGMDAVISQLSMIWGIMSWLAHFFISIIQTVITILSGIVESIPVAE